MSKPGHIYLLREREFIRLGEPTYKIGKTKQSIRRFKGYPHDSHILLFMETNVVDEMEIHLIEIFRAQFTPREEYGAEYFTGDPLTMKQIIIDACLFDDIPVIMELDIVPEVGFLTRIFQGLGIISGPKPTATTINNAIDIFLLHIKTNPYWYIAGEWMPGGKLHEKFYSITGYKTTLSALSKHLRGKIFNHKSRKKIDGKTMICYKLLERPVDEPLNH